MNKRLAPWVLVLSLSALAVPAVADVCNGSCTGTGGGGTAPNLPRISISDGFFAGNTPRGQATGGVSEGDVCSFTIHRSRPRNRNSSIKWRTRDGSATHLAQPGDDNSDYNQASGKAVFTSEQPTDITIGVQTNNDSQNEGDEAFTVVLFDPVNGTVADVSGRCVIHNVGGGG